MSTVEMVIRRLSFAQILSWKRGHVDSPIALAEPLNIVFGGSDIVVGAYKVFVNVAGSRAPQQWGSRSLSLMLIDSRFAGEGLLK